MTRLTDRNSPIALIEVSADGRMSWPGGSIRCALGRSGVRRDKREGDGATPVGTFPLRELWFRPDRLPRPETLLDIREIEPTRAWCDDPRDGGYNRAVWAPYPASHERLWREDHLYDLIVPLGYNDAPAIRGLGSAIFLHVAAPDYRPTEGCVAIARDDLLTLLKRCGPVTMLSVSL